jgi:hypothetical protein
LFTRAGSPALSGSYFPSFVGCPESLVDRPGAGQLDGPDDLDRFQCVGEELA